MKKTIRYTLASGVAVLALTSLALAQGPGGFDGPPPGGEGGGPPRGMPPFPVLLALDADRDGTISAREIANASAALKKLDKNHDGKLTEDEMRPKFGGGPGGPGGQRPNPAERVARLLAGDKNHDGKLSKAELPQQFQGVFSRADANRDGFLSRAELQKFAQNTGGGSGGPPR